MLSKQDETEIISMLAKLPSFDPTWSDYLQRRWWLTFNGLMAEAQRRDKQTFALPLSFSRWGSIELPRPLTVAEWDRLMLILDALAEAVRESADHCTDDRPWAKCHRIVKGFFRAAFAHIAEHFRLERKEA